jgi:hypothetical protein
MLLITWFIQFDISCICFAVFTQIIPGDNLTAQLYRSVIGSIASMLIGFVLLDRVQWLIIKITDDEVSICIPHFVPPHFSLSMIVLISLFVSFFVLSLFCFYLLVCNWTGKGVDSLGFGRACLAHFGPAFAHLLLDPCGLSRTQCDAGCLRGVGHERRRGLGELFCHHSPQVLCNECKIHQYRGRLT